MTDTSFYALRGSDSHTKTLGITQRVTPLVSPWTGELRVRFSDFLVNEIGQDGTVIHLRTIDPGWEQNRESQSKAAPPSQKSGEPRDTTNGLQNESPYIENDREIATADVAALENLAGQKFAQDVIQLFKGSQGADQGRKSVVSEVIDDKIKRGQIHQEVRRIFESKLETSTDASGAITAKLAPPMRKGKQRRGGRNHRREEDKATGEYLHFTLVKDNRDTLDAVNQIARLLKVKSQSVGYAGTKDRRASAVQRCSVRFARSKVLAGLNGILRGVCTGDYEYTDVPIHLGALLGNEFVITIKNCHMAGEEDSKPLCDRLKAIRSSVDSALDHLATHGWINYFGHQRFGTHEIGTHEIGKLILGDKFEEAVNALLSYDPEIAEKGERGEVPDEVSKRDEIARHQACMLFMTEKDIERAATVMPRRFSAEISVMRQLTRQGPKSRNDFVGAIIHITRGLRSMYMHAYQSLVWNYVASRRWELYGDKVVKGDLVIAESDNAPVTTGQDQDGDDIINPVDEEEDDTVRTRPLTEEEASSGSYTIYDIVLPSPGYDVTYPDNEIGAFYSEFMGRAENGGLDPHNMRRRHREFSMPGRYRKLMHRFLSKPSAEVRAYALDTEQMHPTDMDVINAAKQGGRKRGPSNSGDDNGHPNKRTRDDAALPDGGAVHGEGKTEPPPATDLEAPAPAEGHDTAPDAAAADKIAVVVKFQLGKSAYATVALRELMGEPPQEGSG